MFTASLLGLWEGSPFFCLGQRDYYGKLLVLLSKGKTMIRVAVSTEWCSYSTYPGSQVDAIKLSAADFNRQPVKNNPRQQRRSLTTEGGARGNNLLLRSSAPHFRKVGPSTWDMLLWTESRPSQCPHQQYKEIRISSGNKQAYLPAPSHAFSSPSPTLHRTPRAAWGEQI